MSRVPLLAVCLETCLTLVFAMPISGLVVSLVSDRQLREEAIATIKAEPCIEVGVIQSQRMAIVLDTPSTDDDKRLWCWLSSLPGVVFVDVAMVAFEDPESEAPEQETSESSGSNACS